MLRSETDVSKTTRTNDVEYHISWNATRLRWDVQRNGGHTSGFGGDWRRGAGGAVLALPVFSDIKTG